MPCLAGEEDVSSNRRRLCRWERLELRVEASGLVCALPSSAALEERPRRRADGPLYMLLRAPELGRGS